MDRNLLKSLSTWKASRNRKPLLLKGARQTGKTWLVKEFGRREFESCAYIDLLENPVARSLFNADFDLDRIISGIKIESGQAVIPGSTLVIIDEIQESPRALTCLKYFQQNMPDLHVIAAGSYLGIAKHAGESYPVGKVDELRLQPLSFDEFLDAVGQGPIARQLRAQGAADIDPAFSDKLASLLGDYLFVGGMPEVVADFAEHRDFAEARRLQNLIADAYDNDFSKHAPSRILERMRLVWNSLPSQLAKENRKFVYGALRKGARAREFEESIQWLVDYGAVVKAPRARALREPLRGYEDASAFKLFCVDVGLLGALARLSPSAVVDGTAVFTEFKGSLTEQYVCQQLASQDLNPCYWSAERSDAEVDFAVEGRLGPLPIEVKAAENLKSKSLRAARERFGLERCLRTSLSNYRDEGWLVNVPLWGMCNVSGEL